ncbi:MAG: MFS transporter, partial [Acidimicrobiales bacterium]
ALPGIIFALPSGAVGDATDRRLVLLSAKTVFLLGVTGLALLAVAGGLSPFGLLVFMAMLGTAGTFSAPAWWATLGEIVPEVLLPRALSLDGLQFNLGQMIGPVLGGVLLATIGAGGMFAVAAALMTGLVAFLFVWQGRHRRRPFTPGHGSAERMAGAVAVGLRYLRNAPALQLTCWRTFLFVLPASALSALLPLLASRGLGVGAVDYGLLLSAVGLGSVIGALALPKLHERFHLDVMLGTVSLFWAACTAVLALAHDRVVAGIALAGTGGAWLIAFTALNLSAQQAVPRWVLSRALGAYLMVFQTSIFLGGLLWGGVADVIGVRLALLVACGAVLPGVLLVHLLGLPVVDRHDMQVVARPQPDLMVEPGEEDGPVMVLVDYQVDQEDYREFVDAMDELRAVRRRTGVTRWGLFEDARRPGRFLESFVVPSWGGYLLQRNRYTAFDLRTFDAATALNSCGEPCVSYFVDLELTLTRQRRARWRRWRGLGPQRLGPKGRLPRNH